MAEGNEQLQWSDDQWNRVRQVVYEEARRARVAGNVLPLFGPLGADARYVTEEKLMPPEEVEGKKRGFTVEDGDTLKLSTLQTRVYLKGAQVADPELSSALIAFRRAANVIAHLEDAIVFNGQAGASQGPPYPNGEGRLWEVRGGQETAGLLKTATQLGHIVEVPQSVYAGKQLVSAVSEAIGELEGRFHLGPFACILDQHFFTTAQTPADSSLVLPSDRILPFLGGGPLLRTSTLPDYRGLVIALGGAPIDLVVGTDITVNFLQVTTDPWFVFRVKEKIVLRVNQPDAVVALKGKKEKAAK